MPSKYLYAHLSNVWSKQNAFNFLSLRFISNLKVLEKEQKPPSRESDEVWLVVAFLRIYLGEKGARSTEYTEYKMIEYLLGKISISSRMLSNWNVKISFE